MGSLSNISQQVSKSAVKREDKKDSGRLWPGSDLTMKGVLLKQSDWLGRWNQQFVVLQDNQLVWYKKDDRKEKKKKGIARGGHSRVRASSMRRGGQKSEANFGHPVDHLRGCGKLRKKRQTLSYVLA